MDKARTDGRNIPNFQTISFPVKEKGSLLVLVLSRKDARVDQQPPRHAQLQHLRQCTHTHDIPSRKALWGGGGRGVVRRCCSPAKTEQKKKRKRAETS